MKRNKKFLNLLFCMLLCVSMLFTSSGIPSLAAGYTAEGETADEKTDDSSVVVYFTLSNDGRFVSGSDAASSTMARIPLTVPWFDLEPYGLADFTKTDDNGHVIKKPTALHAIIRALETYYCPDQTPLQVGSDALTVSGSFSSMYMTKFWGHDENLMYYVNHAYPFMSEGIGATADWLLLSEGDELDFAMFSDYSFYFSGAFAAFHKTYQQIFTDEPTTLNMYGVSTSSMGSDADTQIPMTGESIFISDDGGQSWTDSGAATDADGNVTLSFDEAGVYYISSHQDGSDYQTFPSDSGSACVAPPIAVIIVNDAPEPVLLKDVVLTDNFSAEYPLHFNPDTHEYEITVPDTVNSLAITATCTDDTAATLNAAYQQAATTAGPGTSYNRALTSGSKKNLNGLIYVGSSGNTLTLTASMGKTTQSYQIRVNRTRSLSSLALSSGAIPLTLSSDFQADLYQYSVDIPENADSIDVQAVSYKNASYHYGISANDVEITSNTKTAIPISATDTMLPITVSHTDGSSSTYEITLNRKKNAAVSFAVLPKDSKPSVRVFTSTGIEITPNEDDTFTLLDGTEYTYTVLADGYLYKTGSFTARDVSLTVYLTKESTSNESWPDFRGNEANNAVIHSAVPVSADDASLYWAARYGSGWSAAPSSPILVGEYLYFTSNKSILKMDKTTGEIVASGTMKTTSAFNITPPTYADGKIFVALSNSIIQAFDINTLESLWVFQDTIKGQPNSPITYHDGYLYTGFWANETKDANYVCLSVADEDTSDSMETKDAVWRYTSNGGFYWAGCYVTDDFLLVGTDDGEGGYTSQTSSLLSINPRTGELIDSIDNLNGDIRSTISYDEQTDAFYFTAKGGSFYQIQVNADGSINHDSLRSLSLGGMSTSTPVVHNGRAYIGVSGGAQFLAYIGHNITVIDLDSFTTAYTCPTQGYPQTSGLLTTAYEDTDGYAYIYFIDNYTPGKIRVIKDRPGQTCLNDDPALTYAPILFTPTEAQAQYAICSPIADADGTLYFKNDSGYMMALGNKITSIELTHPADKLVYGEGDSFDPQGMQVTAHYANGQTKDITNYVSYSSDALSLDDKDITISYSHILYQDMEDGDNTNDWNQINVELDPFTLHFDITVLNKSDSEKVNEIQGMAHSIDNLTAAISSVSSSDDPFSAVTIQAAITSVNAYAQKMDLISQSGQDSVSPILKEKIDTLKKTVSDTIKKDTKNQISISGLSSDDWTVGVSAVPILKDNITYQTITIDCDTSKLFSLYDISLTDYTTNSGYVLRAGSTVQVSMPAVAYDTAKYKGVMIIHKRHDNTVEYITPQTDSDGNLTFYMDSFSPVGIIGIPYDNAPLQTDTDADNSGGVPEEQSITSAASSVHSADSIVKLPASIPEITSNTLDSNAETNDMLTDSSNEKAADTDSTKSITAASKPPVYDKITSFPFIVTATVLILLLITAVTVCWVIRKRRTAGK